MKEEIEMGLEIMAALFLVPFLLLCSGSYLIFLIDYFLYKKKGDKNEK